MPVTAFATARAAPRRDQEVGGTPASQAARGHAGPRRDLAETAASAKSIMRLQRRQHEHLVQEYIKEAQGQRHSRVIVGGEVVASMMRSGKWATSVPTCIARQSGGGGC